MNKNKLFNIIAITVISVMIIVAIIMLSLSDATLNSGAIVTLAGIISVVTVQLVTNSKIESNTTKTVEIQHQLTNGLITTKVNEALALPTAQANINNAVNNKPAIEPVSPPVTPPIQPEPPAV